MLNPEWQRVNPVAAVGAAVGLLALLSLPFFSPSWLLFKANRLVEGETFTPLGLSPSWTFALVGVWLVVALLSFIPVRGRPWWVSLLASAGLIIALLFVADATNTLLVEARSSARVSLQGGVWLTLLAYYIGIYGALYEAEGPGWRKALMVAPGLCWLRWGLFLRERSTSWGWLESLPHKGATSAPRRCDTLRSRERVCC